MKMIRAILFDFYGVWTPDHFSEYLALAEQQDPALATELRKIINKYYLGLSGIDYVINSFRFKLSSLGVPDGIFELKSTDISPAVADFMRSLHGHFLKLGVLANIGRQEQALLAEFNATHQLLEVIVSSSDVGGSVLSQEAFATALHDIGEPPESCLAVAGSDEYQQFAESCGISCLRFQTFPLLRQALAERLDHNQ